MLQKAGYKDELIPDYLKKIYWWAYLHPFGVKIFDKPWMVNLILCGQFKKLTRAVFAEVNSKLKQDVLQVACVYGNFSQRLFSQLNTDSSLTVVDIVPMQLENAHRKFIASQAKIAEEGRGKLSSSGHPKVKFAQQNSAELGFQDEAFDTVVVFFLLHEQPFMVRQRTVQEALRVVKPGGKVIFVDYHKPKWYNPLKYLLYPVLFCLEPFAMDLWDNAGIEKYLAENVVTRNNKLMQKQTLAKAVGFKEGTVKPAEDQPRRIKKETFLAGLYQKVTVCL